MDSEDGVIFVKHLADFVRTHERALANALQQNHRPSKDGQQHAASGASSNPNTGALTTPILLSEALSRPYLSFSTPKVRNAKLAFTPHHLFYLLSKFEELGVDIGPMNVRLENLQNDLGHANYVSFLGNAPRNRGKQADAESLRSVSSMRSVMSSVTSLWSNLTLNSRAAKIERQMTQYREDIRYLYSCFTKVPAIKLAPDSRARLIAGFEEFPFDTAVPLFAFKNVSSLEICDLDFRQFYGWDRLAEQLRTLTVRRACVDDPIDLLQHIVLDDMEKRRKRSFKTNVPATPSTPGASWASNSPRPKQSELARAMSAPIPPYKQRQTSKESLPSSSLERNDSGRIAQKATPPQRDRSTSPPRLLSSRHGSLTKHSRAESNQYRRSSGSSNSSAQDTTPRHSTTDLLALGILPSSKWRFLRHLSLAENGLHTITAASLAPVASTLQSFDLSGNLFSEVPDALASLTHLRALNLANCMIDSLQSLARHPIPAIVTLNLRSNRLLNLSGIERLISLERVDLRDNRLRDPTELARLTGFPDVRDVYVIRNPFVKTHATYRVTIFNLFRKTPGHVQDVTIDGLAPMYGEKRYLIDRTPEPINVPVIKPPLEDEEEAQAAVGAEPVESQSDLPPLESILSSGQRQGHRRATSDLGPQSTRRKKKAPRRRVVELSTPDSTPGPKSQKSIPDLAEAAPKTPTDSDQPSTPEQTPFHTAPTKQIPSMPLPEMPAAPSLNLMKLETSPTPAPKIRNPSDDDDDDDNDASPIASPQGLGHPDAYRQKMEALRADMGPSWLTTLKENVNGPEHPLPSQQQPRTLPPPPLPPVSSQVHAQAKALPTRRSFSPSSRTSTIKADSTSTSARGVSVGGGGGRTLG